MSRLLCVVSAVAVLSGQAMADQVLWSYSMSEIPPGWFVDVGTWTFEPDGAHSDAFVLMFQTDWNSLRSNTLVLPPGTDSVTITAEQYTVVWETALPNTFAVNRMVVGVNGVDDIYWNVSGVATDSLPIYVTIPATAGDDIAIQLICAATCEPPPETPPDPDPQATANFHVWNFVVTARGNIVDLDTSTWGLVKVMLGIGD